MIKISCLLLAAGESRRMGAVNKLLLPIAGKSFVRRTAEELLKFPFQEIIAVTGHEANLVANEVRFPTVKTIFNANYQTGMHSSIRAGLKSFRAIPDGFMICLSDQPLFNIDVVAQLAQNFSELKGPRIVFPTLNQKRGHPVFISKDFISEILNEPDGDYGCNYLFKRHAENLFPISVQDASVLVDVDTPEQYKELETAV